MSRSVKIASLLFALVVGTTLSAQDAKEKPARKESPPNPSLEKLKTLAGEWVARTDDESGQAEQREDHPARMVYRVIAAGSVVLEHMFPGTDHEMVTMYHCDGPDVMLTHYCAAGNQPQMKLQPGADPHKLVFKFSGGTNLDPAKDGHMHDLTWTFADADHARAEWTYYQDGKQVRVTKFALQRK